MTRLSLLTQSVRDLGLVPVLRNGWYRILLKSGIYRTVMPHRPLRNEVVRGEFRPLPLPDMDQLINCLSADSARIFDEKELIFRGEYHPFGSKNSLPLKYEPRDPYTDERHHRSQQHSSQQSVPS